MKLPTIRINDFSITLRAGQWVARKSRKMVARNDDWITLMQAIGINKKEDIK